VSTGPEGSILKVFGSQLGTRIAEAAGELLGMHALVNQGSEMVPDAPRCSTGSWPPPVHDLRGTSEIQRNIIASACSACRRDEN